ncbi:MAG: ribonuclease P protein component [Bacteroidia bacterium]|nr:ribonuclease P protein component [Bacteroidia bacterium]
MKQRFTLKKHQIIKNNKEVTQLFENGKTFVQYPLKSVSLLYHSHDLTISTKFKVVFIVPKKYIRKATKRNKIKRKIKEAFRLLQHYLIDPPEKKIYLIGFIYTAKESQDELLDTIYDCTKYLIEQINQEYTSHQSIS